MQFFLTFLEGFISFVSPCMLPMLPIYVSYFSGGADKKKNVFARALAFVVGFTAVFCLLGLLSFIYLAKTDKRFFTLTNDDEKGIAEESLLTMKQKCTACFTSVGIVICLAIFTSEMLLNLIPTDVLTNILR